jgi:hypothetical protein
MSKEIVCIAAAAAETDIRSTLIFYQDACKNIMKRMNGKLNTKNPHLLPCVRTAINCLHRCKTEASSYHWGIKSLSKNPFNILKAGLIQLLDTTRRLECVIRPFEHDWVSPTWDVQLQCEAACIMLSFIAEDLYLVRRIARLVQIPKYDSGGPPLEQCSDIRAVPLNSPPSWKAFEKV